MKIEVADECGGLRFVVASDEFGVHYLVGTPAGEPYVERGRIAFGSYGRADTVQEAVVAAKKFADRFNGWAVMLNIVGGLPEDMVAALKGYVQ